MMPSILTRRMYMNRLQFRWPGELWWSLCGLLVAGAMARGESPSPLADQLLDLGRQAMAQGAHAQAKTFYQKVLTLEPGHVGARQALDRLPRIERVSMVRQVG